MKHIIVLSCLFLILLSCKQSDQNLVLTDKGSTKYRIIYASNANDSLIKAVDALKSGLKLVTGVEIQAFADLVGKQDHEILIGKSKRTADYDGAIPYDKLGSEGYYTRTAGQNWIITGNNSTAITQGIYDIFNKLGSIKLVENMTQYSMHKTLQIKGDPGTIFIPSFTYRQAISPYALNADYRAWNKINVDNQKDWGTWGYSMANILPEQPYFKNHPEFFALIGNTHVSNQINFADTSTHSAVSKNLEIWTMGKGRAKYWAVSPYSNHIVSEDAKTQSIIKETGSAAGPVIQMVNDIASKNKDRIYSIWLDGPYRKACVSCQVAQNVMLVLDTKDTDHSASLADGTHNESFRKDLMDWKKITPHLAVVMHITNEENYLMPFPNLHAMQKSFQYLHDQGVDKIILNGDSGAGTSFADLKFYVGSSLAWDVSQNVDTLISRYCENTYGKASSSMYGYIQALERTVQDGKSKLAYNSNPSSAFRSWMTPAIINQLYTYFNNVVTITQNNSEVKEKVEKEKLGLIYTQLEVAKSMGTKTFGYFMNLGALRSQLIKTDQSKLVAKQDIDLGVQKAEWKPIQGMKDLLAQFVRDCATWGVKTIDSKGTTPEQYQAMTLKFLDQKVEVHQGFRKGSFSFNASPDPEFADGDPSTLNDGLYGIAEAPQTNWLALKGGEGEVTWDLGKDTMVTSVSVRFLQSPAQRAWAPNSITCMVSTDGKSFTDVKNTAISLPGGSSQIISQTFNFGRRSIQAIKIKTTSKAVCPPDHILSGEPAVVLLDEMVIR
jgi:hypothetical protein